VLEELEPRLLMSADLNPLAHDALLATPAAGGAEFRALTDDGRPSAVTTAAVAPIQRTNEIVFVDPRVPDREQLLAELTAQVAEGRHFEIITLDPNRAGIAQVTEALKGKVQVDAIHFITHGADGAVQLGGTWLDAKALAANSEAVAKWGESLKADADLLFYGCDLSATASGRALVDWIAELTRADVAASTDATGSARQGGDWDLEYRTGEIETPVVVSLPAQGEWDHLLATFTVTNTNDAGAGSLRQAIAGAEASAGTDTIAFALLTSDANYNVGTGVWTIGLGSELETIDNSTIIDGWSQAGWVDKPLIELNGSAASNNADGLQFTAGTSVVRGLIINGFGQGGAAGGGGTGIIVEVNAQATIQGNYIGTNATGTGLPVEQNGDWGILLFSNGSTVGGTAAFERNVISGNDIDGIRVDGGDGNVIQGNYIGTDVTGTADLGNAFDGIWLTNGANNNTIGGAAAGERNVISGNNRDGVNVENSANNRIQGNYIGTNAAGTAPLGNGRDGIGLNNAASLNTIGGTALGAGNVLSGNVSNGIELNGAGTANNVVFGNIIGLDFAGNTPIANGTSGIFLTGASANTIGGTAAGARNVISGNGLDGVQGQNVNGTIIQGNYIGTDGTGTLDRGNGQNGIWLDGASSNNTIGGTALDAGNVISGNALAGIEFAGTGSGNIAQGNYIGTNATGSALLGNSNSGVRISGTTGTTVGGTVIGAGNVIAYNAWDGVNIAAGTGHAVLGNSIYSNGQIGIDLEGSSDVDPNDNNDIDTGTNALQNFPVLLGGSYDGTTLTVTATLNTALGTYRIEFFASSAADPSGHGEGGRYLGFTTVSLAAAGTQPLNWAQAGITLNPGEVITATATNTATGNTSEFSAALYSVTGKVYEDVNGNGAVGDDGLGRDGVDVRLYLDANQNGTPDAGDGAAVATAVTSGGGNYWLLAPGVSIGLANGQSFVVVDSRDITPNAGVIAPPNADDVWADQTYAYASPIGADSVQAIWHNGAYQFQTSAGAFYGGLIANRSDDGGFTLNAGAAPAAEHIQRLTIGAGSAGLTGVDSGFSFSAVTNNRGDAADFDVGGDRMQQGSLRQFLLNSNAIVGVQAAEFAIGPVGSVQSIALGGAALPPITDRVVLDAWTQGAPGS